jgi:hypothetical protein
MRIAFRLSVVRASRAFNSIVAPAFVACGAFLLGCGDGNSGGSGGAGSGGGTSVGSNTVVLTQDNNFQADTALTIPPAATAPGVDVNICWDKITTDVQGHPLDPKADINDVSFVQVNTNSADQVAQWLNTGALTASRIAKDFEYKPKAGETCAKLSQFTPPTGGAAVNPSTDYKIQDNTTYLVVFATGTRLGYGARTMLILTPSSDSQSIQADAKDNSSSMLKYVADLHSLQHVQVKADAPPRVDWSKVANNGQGLAIGQNDVTSILVGFYEGKSVTDLETGFLNLDQATAAEGGPSQSWKISVSNVRAANLVDAPGRLSEAPLASFSPTDGIWLLGMFCDDCQNPAPEIVTILDPK